MEFLSQPKYWVEIARELLEAIKGESEEVHEPETNVWLVGDHLDNAFGNDIRSEALVDHYQEFVLVFDNPNTKRRIPINLACLIALAGKAAEDLVAADEGREEEDTVETILKRARARLRGLPNSKDRREAITVLSFLSDLVTAPADQKERKRENFREALK